MTSGDDFVLSIFSHDGKPVSTADLRPGDILIEPAHDVFGAAARLFGEPDQHALFVSHDTTKAWEGIAPGVGLNKISKKKPYRVYRLRDFDGVTAEAIVAKMLEHAKADEHKPYGFVQLALYGVRILGRKINPNFNIRLGTDDNSQPQVCSGYISRWARRAGVDLCPFLPDEEVAPDDLAASELLFRAY